MTTNTETRSKMISSSSEQNSSDKPQTKNKLRVVMIMKILFVHTLAIYALFRLHDMKIWTIFYAIFLHCLSGTGTTGGAHRLWTHGAYKAKWPLKLFLFISFAMASHLSLYTWIRIHRQHHKFTDTEADPHNSKRGFFFAHIGWLMLDKSPECRQKEKGIDMSDLVSDPFVKFHSRYFYLITVLSFPLVSVVPVYFWGEDAFLSFLAAGMLRYVGNLHVTLSVNSIAHMFGARPYNKRILPTDGSVLACLTLGEGWHNYHHTFPWDYKAGEFGDRFNSTARLLDFFAKIGWAYDLKTASPELISKTKAKNGATSH